MPSTLAWLRIDTGAVIGAEVTREDVVAFLAERHDTGVEELQPLKGGTWSSAWAYRGDGEELVIRFGPKVAWFEADRAAMAFTGPELPVPEVREVGTTANARAYAISVRQHGRFLEDTPVQLAGALAPTLTRLLVALLGVPGAQDSPVLWTNPAPRRAAGGRSCCPVSSMIPASRRTVGVPPWPQTAGWRRCLGRSPTGYEH
jgi:hypothetical protein